jgi:predicted nucleic acid-binding protein
MGVSKVFLDTNIFIYLIEDRGELGRRTAELVEQLIVRRDSVYTSALTLGEVLAQPLSKGDVSLAERYEQLLRSPGVHLLDFNVAAARAYARIRTDRSIKAPDALQLSVAATAECDLFITNDDRLSKKVVKGIQFVMGLAQVPF